MKKIIKLLALTSTLVGLTACGSGTIEDDFEPINPGTLPDKKPGVDYDGLKPYDEEVTIDVIGINYSPTLDVPKQYDVRNNAFVDAAKDFLNIKLNFVSVEAAEQYEEKLNLRIASNNLPDIFRVTDLTTLQRLKEGNMLADLGDTFHYLNKNYQDMYKSTLYKPALEAVMDEGTLSCFPNVLNPNEKAQRFYIRKDWLECLNLQVPTSYEKLIEVATAFKNNANTIVEKCFIEDSGVKAKDIVPIGMTKSVSAVGNNTAAILFNVFGTRPNAFFEQDGELYDSNTSEEMKQALIEMKSLYEKGLLAKEFYNKTDTNISNDIIGGKVGIVGGMRHNPSFPLQDSVNFSDTPGAEWVAINIPDKNGKYIAPVVDTVLFEDFNCVSKNCKHPEAAAKLTNLFYDMFYSDDAAEKYPGYTEPSEGFFYSWVPSKIWYTPYTIDSYKRVNKVFDELKQYGFVISDEKLSEMESDRFDWENYYEELSTGEYDLDPSKKTNPDDPDYSEIFNKLWVRERNNGFKYGYPYMQALSAGKKHSQMSKFEKRGFGIYTQAIAKNSGDAYVSDLSDGKYASKADKFYGMKTPAQQNYGEYLYTCVNKFILKCIIGESDPVDDWNSYVKDYNNNGGEAVLRQVNQWYKTK